jgi:aminoglycoside phosphotransferase (APT) family kinase protein
MGRVDGQAPPDLKPYVFESWLKVAPLEAQAAVQRGAIAMLSELHRMDVSADELAFLEVDAPGDTPLRRHVNHQRAYYRWVAEDLDLPILDRAFAWLEDHWPAEEGPTAVSWGDSRIGNILWRDFEPVAMLDWEMAAVGPPEIDLAWMIYMHRFFQEVAERFGYEGMPQFMTPADTATTYEALSGYPPRDLDWYLVYAGVRYAIIITRIARRSMHFGETTMPDDAEDLVANRQALEQLLAGTYWTR